MNKIYLAAITGAPLMAVAGIANARGNWNNLWIDGHGCQPVLGEEDQPGSDERPQKGDVLVFSEGECTRPWREPLRGARAVSDPNPTVSASRFPR
jgi:hypothetical protein